MAVPAVTLHDLAFKIGDFSLRGINLDVETGEYYVVTGPNGAGKTILVKLIVGLLRAGSGTIAFNGRDVTSSPPWERGIGYVPQDGLLFPNRTVARNIAFGLEVRGLPRPEQEAAVKEAADQIGVAHLLDRTIHDLSGGERQRVSMARAIVLKPEVLLLDEPVSAIDETARDELCGELVRLKRTLRITVIHVAHNSREIDLVADRVVRMERGQITGVSRVAEFRGAGAL